MEIFIYSLFFLHFRTPTWHKQDMRLLCWRTKRSGRQWYPCLQQRRYHRETSNHSTSKSFDEHCLRSRMFVKHLQATWFLDYGTPSLHSSLYSSLHFLFAVNFIPLSSPLMNCFQGLTSTRNNCIPRQHRNYRWKSILIILFLPPPSQLQTSSWVQRDTETNWRSSGA